jgi:hypothetical protein
VTRPQAVEVVLVSPGHKGWNLEALLTLLVASLLGGLYLMVLLPLAAETFDVTLPAPSYVRCCLLVLLTRSLAGAAFGALRPAARR